MAARSHSSLSTPDIPVGSATFTAYSSTRIAAPASLVFRTLRNSDTWRDWNRFVPRVTITYQPPEIEDLATAAEIRELIKNTSLAGSVDSDITDGAAPGTRSLTGRRLSIQEEESIRRSPPPVTRERLRSVASTASTASMHTARSQRQQSNVNERPKSGISRPSTDVGSAVETNGTTTSQLSGDDQHAHPSPLGTSTSTTTPSGPGVQNNKVLVQAPHNPDAVGQATATKTVVEAANSQSQSRRSSYSEQVSAAEKHRRSIHALYGEPSVRIQLGTKMTLFCRMHLPKSWQADREIQVVVTEVSRPDNPSEADDSTLATPAMLGADPGLATTARLRKSATHTPNKTGVYRLVWTLRSSYSMSSLSSAPKFLLQAQRVHEIRPVIAGDGSEECVYDDWECHRGVLAKGVKTKYEDYLNQRFEEWGNGLKAYCEALGGAVERRDFVAVD
ncbi:hypothetical protein DV736_g2147, partial [Chaetothyriales sp. CBS 134916]